MGDGVLTSVDAHVKYIQREVECIILPYGIDGEGPGIYEESCTAKLVSY